MFKRVLLCYDGSVATRRALRRGAELAIALNAHAFVLSIVAGGIEDPFLVAGATGHACIMGDSTNSDRQILDESVAWLRSRGLAADGYLASGDILDQITTFTKRLNIDLIVLGHYPRQAGGYWWSGPQRISLAERANCCVLVAVDVPGDRASSAIRGPWSTKDTE